MKKLFTLLFAVGLISVAQAQYDQRNYPQNDQRGFDKSYGNGNVFNNNPYGNDGRYDNKNFSFDRGRDIEIARINQEYEFKIQRVMRSPFMSWYEKKRQVHFLQEQRQREISMVYERGYDHKGHFDDHDYHSRDRW